ncbi:MAG: hypothetical protein ACLP1X_23545 [Polyangiaceae bacterium]|jgi:hypothetical protein
MRSRNWASAVALPSLAVAVLAASVALADDTIRRPGDHADYAVEIEPQLLWGWEHYNYAPTDGVGLGARFSIPILTNGFVPSINDSVAISFGVDWLHYSYGGCYYYNGYRPGYCANIGDANYILFPVAMQWNFFVARHWSVFGEPGLNVYHGFLDYCSNVPAGYPCANPATTTGIEFAFSVGGRYQFSDHAALVMRIGFPTFSLGVSFM